MLPSIATATPDPTPVRWSVPAPKDASPGLAWQVTTPTLAPGESGRVTISVALPEGYALDRGSLELVALDPVGLTWGGLQAPAGRVVPTADGESSPKVVLSGDLSLEVPVEAPDSLTTGSVSVRLLVSYQGCFRGLCHPYTTDVVDTSLPIQR